MKLISKTILIISPQQWGDSMVSKHHYAMELAIKGNDVYFLNPILYGKYRTEIRSVSNINGLSIINYGLSISNRIRFHARWFFDILIQSKIKKILKLIGKPIDVVWCFEPNLITDLNWFKSELKIYHPVDYLNENHQLVLAINADIIFSVAENILDLFKKIETPRFFINHGLSENYSKLRLTEYIPHQNLKVCYVGNLMIQGLDKDSIRTIIERHSNIQFDFYGNYSFEEDTFNETVTFVKFLLNQPNVKLIGVLNPKELSQQLLNYDAFILCYKPNEELNFGSNSHKLLEYLSTGRLVVSSLVKTYEKYSDIIVMSKRNDNQDYVDLFDNSIYNINKLNGIELMKRRRDLALSNTYSKQIGRIESLLH